MGCVVYVKGLIEFDAGFGSSSCWEVGLRFGGRGVGVRVRWLKE